jgi:MFS family permease
MDTLGAVIGPALALVLMALWPGDFRKLFLFAFLPGVGAIVLTMLLRERPSVAQPDRKPFGFRQGFRYWSRAPAAYRRLVAGLLFFALINSSDLLLLLRIREAGHSDRTVIAIYIFYNLAYALLAYPLGKLADRFGIKRMMLLGLFFFALTYAGFALANGIPGFLALFAGYGLYAAATEGISKAWIAKLVPKNETASAMGTYAGFQSIAALLASSWAGAVWYAAGSGWAFGITAAAGLMVLGYLWRLKES